MKDTLENLLNAIKRYLGASTTPGGRPGEALEKLREAMREAEEMLASLPR